MSRLQAFGHSSTTVAFWKQVMLNMSCLNGATTSVLIENIIYGSDPIVPKLCFNRFFLLTSSRWCFSYNTSANRFSFSFNLLFLYSLFFPYPLIGLLLFFCSELPWISLLISAWKTFLNTIPRTILCLQFVFIYS